jgi:hypothetical protein
MFDKIKVVCGGVELPICIKTNKQINKHMTEQSLIEYAKRGDLDAITHLENAGVGVDWKYAITQVNGRSLTGEEIKRTWDEMINIHKETGLSMEEINNGLQAALNEHHKPLTAAEVAGKMLSPADRPWDFKNKSTFKIGGRGPNRTPPKKRRK